MDTYTTCKSNNTHLSKTTWFGCLCYKKKNNNTNSGHINSNFHKRGERFAFTIRKNEIDNPEKNQKDNMLEGVIKDWKENWFHSFEYRCEHDIRIEHKISG